MSREVVKMYQYQERSAQDWQHNQEVGKGPSETFIKEAYRSKQFKPGEGFNSIRILPPDPAWGAKARHYGLTIYRHLGIGPHHSAFLCHDVEINDALLPGRVKTGDPICALNGIASKQGNKELSAQLYAKPGVLVWLIDRAHPEKGPQWWIMPPSKINKEICLRAFNPKSQKGLPVDHPENGYDISFTYEKNAGGYPQYTGVDIDREASPIATTPLLQEKVLNFIVQHSLIKILKYHTFEQMNEALLAGLPNTEVETETVPTAGKETDEIDWDVPVKPQPIDGVADPVPTSVQAPATASAQTQAAPETAPQKAVESKVQDTLKDLGQW